MSKVDQAYFLNQINENSGIIHKICRIYSNSLLESEELKQEIIFQLWKSYPSYENKAKFSTWMYKISFNTAIAGIRRNWREIKPENFDENLIMDDYQNLDYDERIKDLYRAISQLSKIDKAIIMLYLEENSYNEISEIMGISEKNVSVRIVRIKDKLIKIVREP
ncbi:MAG: RNA polymerase sigma factor [Candidatus Delongbacteria bacterium]|nr:RNA polymerase sigma factor [Candidatus Delongbacteria bacterium]MBN2833580.1 RNA polymerase sigma factor [Candidatus Delongbacteria bacterium]